VGNEDLELVDQVVGDLRGGLEGSLGSSTEGRVNLGGLVNHVVNDGLSRLDPRCQSLG
jgi:hypothetical protein